MVWRINLPLELFVPIPGTEADRRAVTNPLLQTNASVGRLAASAGVERIGRRTPQPLGQERLVGSRGRHGAHVGRLLRSLMGCLVVVELALDVDTADRIVDAVLNVS